MAQKKLTSELEFWLFENYSLKSNEDLALELNRRLREMYAKRKAHLEEILPVVTDARVKRNVMKELKQISKFKGISVCYIRQMAYRLNWPKKASTTLAEINRTKADRTNDIKWSRKAMKVENFPSYIKSMRVREKRYCVVADDRQLRTYRNAISRFNNEDGTPNSIMITAVFDKKLSILRLVAISRKHGRQTSSRNS